MSKSDVAGLWGSTIILMFYLALVFSDNFFLNLLYSNFIAMLTCIGLIAAVGLLGRTFYYTSFYLKNHNVWKSDNRELKFKNLTFNRFYSLLLGIVFLFLIATLVFVPGEITKKAELLYFIIISIVIFILGEVLEDKIKKSIRFTSF